MSNSGLHGGFRQAGLGGNRLQTHLDRVAAALRGLPQQKEVDDKGCRPAIVAIASSAPAELSL
jgi:hypothetical protein